jgi:hypothetical protein
LVINNRGQALFDASLINGVAGLFLATTPADVNFDGIVNSQDISAVDLTPSAVP